VFILGSSEVLNVSEKERKLNLSSRPQNSKIYKLKPI